VDADRGVEHRVGLHGPSCARVGGDAGVLEGLRDTQELRGVAVAEVVVRLLHGVATELFDGVGDGTHVSGLVVADELEVARHLLADAAAVVHEDVGVHQLGVAEVLEAVTVEGVLEVLQGERVVEDVQVGGVVLHLPVVLGAVIFELVDTRVDLTGDELPSDLEHIVDGSSLVDGLGERIVVVDQSQERSVAGFHRVDTRGHGQQVVVDDFRRGARVGGDAGVLECLTDGEELRGRVVAEVILAFHHCLAVEVLNGCRERVDVGLLVSADGPQVVGHLHPDGLVELRERIGVHQLVVAELIEAVAVERVLEVLQRERVVQDGDVRCRGLGRRRLGRRVSRLLGRLLGRRIGHHRLVGFRRRRIAAGTAGQADS